jgi:hypothetical protein
VRRTSAVVRAWDGPNSRIAFELDLDQMPWGPFEALGKKVTVLIPEGADPEDRPISSVPFGMSSTRPRSAPSSPSWGTEVTKAGAVRSKPGNG